MKNMKATGLAIALFAGFTAFSAMPAQASMDGISKDTSMKPASVVERERITGGGRHRQRHGGELIETGSFTQISFLSGTETESLPHRRGRGADDAPGDDRGRRHGGHGADDPR